VKYVKLGGRNGGREKMYTMGMRLIQNAGRRCMDEQRGKTGWTKMGPLTM
jgi:hypothetical protein